MRRSGINLRLRPIGMTGRQLLVCVFALVLIGERSGAQLSFLPISSREGLTANTSVARSRSSLAPLSNPASSAARGDDQQDSEISISSNLYMLTMVESRGGSDKGSFRSGYSSILNRQRRVRLSPARSIIRGRSGRARIYRSRWVPFSIWMTEFRSAFRFEARAWSS